jgi:hypothetical protein
LLIIPDFGEDSENLRYVGPIVRNIYDSKENLRKNLILIKNNPCLVGVLIMVNF